MMMCAQPVMEQEQQYLAAIQQAATYTIQGTRLELRSVDGALQASYAFQPTGASALVGHTSPSHTGLPSLPVPSGSVIRSFKVVPAIA